MANFKTHVAVAAVVSVGVASFLAGVGAVTYGYAGILAALGILGGILPDIDSDNSTALDIIFNIVSVFFAGLAFLLTYWAYDVGVTLIACVVVFIATRFPIRWLFEKFTIHRGAFHSIAAALMMGLLFTVVANIMLDAGKDMAWYAGLFVALGYLVHLLLDEIYSVDFSNAVIKKSFGSAIKPLSLDYPLGSISIIATGVGLYYLAPEISSLAKIVGLAA